MTEGWYNEPIKQNAVKKKKKRETLKLVWLVANRPSAGIWNEKNKQENKRKKISFTVLLIEKKIY